MFLFLWALLFLSICAGVLVSSIQQPVLVTGKGIVVQQKTAAKNAQDIFVLLLLPPDQPSSLKAGQPVTISIASTNITFHSTVEQLNTQAMSPAAISTKYNLSSSLAQTISGPSIVATAHIEPMSLAQTYLGSQCQAQVQIGTENVLTLIPGVDSFSSFITTVTTTINNLLKG